ncbi:hypothetical protein PHLCEN_2v9838 [Hermanssonia centrifuga]|uniref:Uncharacterized protein n=1 Tax=Hermanssonia centrifuga TaxID=98765 RepID=A0A2R6NPM2_9APHY|nr:hypothetical protein PHLCEN_2v9838 [Hermanssonia centrifuga]
MKRQNLGNAKVRSAQRPARRPLIGPLGWIERRQAPGAPKTPKREEKRLNGPLVADRPVQTGEEQEDVVTVAQGSVKGERPTEASKQRDQFIIQTLRRRSTPCGRA